VDVAWWDGGRRNTSKVNCNSMLENRSKEDSGRECCGITITIIVNCNEAKIEESILSHFLLLPKYYGKTWLSFLTAIQYDGRCVHDAIVTNVLQGWVLL
jgi:hypothetical protein